MRNNFNPNIWGPSGWFFIDTIVLSYPDKPSYEEKKIYKNFLLQLKDILPCSSCRDHYTNNIMYIPLNDYYLSSKYKLIEWIIQIHNKVRKYNGNNNLLTFDSFMQYYDKAFNNNSINNNITNNNIISKNNNDYIYISIIICLLLFFGIYIYYNKKK